MGVIYRPARDETKDEIILSQLGRESCKNLLIMGDFNLPGIDWATPCGSTKYEDDFIEALRDSFLFQHCKEPNRGNNILDLVITAGERDIEHLQNLYPLGTSDHCIVTFEYVTKISRVNNSNKSYDYRKGNFTKIKEEIGGIDWESTFMHMDTEEKWNIFRAIIERVIDKYVPSKKVNKKKKKPWFYGDFKNRTKEES